MVYREIESIQFLIIHCSASDRAEHDDISVIRSWHKERGMFDVGYHYVIRRSGEIQQGRKLYEIGAHCKGHNNESVGICLTGNKHFTEKQFKSCAILIKDLAEILGKSLKSKSDFHRFVFAHKDFDRKKTCPNFDVSDLSDYPDRELIDNPDE